MCNLVLLVEDEADIRRDLAFLLEHQGYEVVTAAHGLDALQQLRTLRNRPCLIILDLMMPKMDGWELRAELLKDDALAEIPVVLLSGVADLQAKARSLRAVDYLNKPIDFQKLYSLVGDHCAAAA